MIRRVSYSYLHTLSCSYQTFLRYEGKIKGRTTHYIALGNALHLALEKLYGKGPPFSITKSLEECIDIFTREYNRIIEDEEVFVSYPPRKKAEKEGIEMLALYFRQLEAGKISKEPIAVEQEFKIPIEGTILVGKIDKIERNDQGLTLIDYKSGSRKPDTWFLSKNLQFSAYALACKEMYGEFPAKIIWHHLKTGEFLETPRTSWDIENLKTTIKSAMLIQENGIRARVYHEKVCEWCPYSGMTGGNGACDDPTLEERILNGEDVSEEWNS